MIKSLGILMHQSRAGGLDLDAEAFITAAGITDSTQKTAINTMVVDLKTANLWTQCRAIYPFVGGSESSHKFNLKDPRDLDAAFRLTFTGTWTHNSNGVQGNGSNAYANTFLTPNVALEGNNSHLSVYSRTNASENKVDIGVYADASFLQGMLIYTRYGDGNCYNDHYQYTTSRISVAVGNSQGYYLSSRIDSITLTLYKNGSSIGSSSGAAGTIPNKNVYIGALNSNGAPANYSSKQLAFASLGYGISSALQDDMYNIVQAFQTTLGRQV